MALLLSFATVTEHQDNLAARASLKGNLSLLANQAADQADLASTVQMSTTVGYLSQGLGVLTLASATWQKDPNSAGTMLFLSAGLSVVSVVSFVVAWNAQVEFNQAQVTTTKTLSKALQRAIDLTP